MWNFIINVLKTAFNFYSKFFSKTKFFPKSSLLSVTKIVSRIISCAANISLMSLGMFIPWKIIYIFNKNEDLKKRIKKGINAAFWIALPLALIYEGTIKNIPPWPKFLILGICIGFLFIPLLFPDVKNAKQIMQIFGYALSTKDPINIKELSQLIQKDINQEFQKV